MICDCIGGQRPQPKGLRLQRLVPQYDLRFYYRARISKAVFSRRALTVLRGRNHPISSPTPERDSRLASIEQTPVPFGRSRESDRRNWARGSAKRALAARAPRPFRLDL
jgi:hypothetical protein